MNPKTLQSLVQAEKARRSLTEFIKQAWEYVDPGMPLRMNWHVECIADHLQAVTEGKIRKLLINIGPGYAKSILTSVIWPAWEWTFDPTIQSIFASYAQSLAERDSVRCRDLMQTEWYQQNFVNGAWDFNPAQNRVDDFANTRKGHRQCLSVGSKATGYRGNKVVCDDSLNVTDANSKIARDTATYWWSKVMPTRVNDPAKGAHVMIGQRVHEEDTSGFILEGGGYEHLCLPTEFEGDRRCVTYYRMSDGTSAEFFRDPRTVEGELLFPALFTPEVVAELKQPLRGLGADGFAGQHQQRPTPAEGGMFKYRWWRFWRPDGVAPESNCPRPKHCTVEPAKVLPALHQVVGSLDAAFKDGVENDYVVFTVWGVRHAERYLLDVVRGKMDFVTTRRTLLMLAAKWPNIRRWLIEDKANGSAIINSLKVVVPGIVEILPEGGKEARASAMSPYCEAGQVFLKDGAEWVQAYVDEFATFPKGKHDDQVDSSSQAIIHLSTSMDVLRAMALGTIE